MEISPGSTNSDPAELTPVGDFLYFTCKPSLNYAVLCKYDTANLVLSTDLDNYRSKYTNPVGLTKVGDKIYMQASLL